MIFENQKISKNFGSLRIFFLLYNTLKTEQKLQIFFLEKKIVSLKKTLQNIFVPGTQREGFQFIVILTP